MTRADNTHCLRLAAQARHDQALQRTRDAIRALDRHGQPITFTAVAATARVSRTWLYRQPELRAAIATHRRTHPAAAIPAAQRTTPESMKCRLDALHAEIEHLRAENATLRDHVARALGQRRLQPEPQQSRHVPDATPQPDPRLPGARCR
jgi:hypothetical protein